MVRNRTVILIQNWLNCWYILYKTLILRKYVSWINLLRWDDKQVELKSQSIYCLESRIHSNELIVKRDRFKSLMSLNIPNNRVMIKENEIYLMWPPSIINGTMGCIDKSTHDFWVYPSYRNVMGKILFNIYINLTQIFRIHFNYSVIHTR